MSRYIIISGGTVNIDFAKEYIKTLSYDKVFAVDKGLEYADELNIIPDLIIGDFDTVNPLILSKYEKKISDKVIASVIKKHPVNKDETDTELAISMALSEKTDEIIILGATGSRIDHMLANIGFLTTIAKAGSIGIIVDECNKVRLLDSKYGITDIKIMKDEQFGKYVSIIPITETVENVTVQGVKYPLDDCLLQRGNGLTVSNEINEKTARFHIGNGAVLIIESRD